MSSSTEPSQPTKADPGYLVLMFALWIVIAAVVILVMPLFEPRREDTHAYRVSHRRRSPRLAARRTA